jgi:glycerol uptake facilitator-like aquaporin
MSRVAGEPCNGSLGDSRSSRCDRFAHANLARIQRSLPNAVTTNRNLRLAPNVEVGRGFITSEIAGDRANGRGDRQGSGRTLKPHNIAQRATAEGLGTAFLLATVVGSGVMAFKLAGGNGAIALLCNTIPTGAILAVLILTFGHVSGAHFNPAVSIAFAIRGELAWFDASVYLASQIVGAIVGVWAAHLMFELPIWQLSTTARTGWGQWFAEGVATFGLLLTIFGCLTFRTDAIPYAVGLYITSAYWFTASTSFANPAVTIGRAFSDTFAGIAPGGVLAFIVAQLIGMLLAVGLSQWIFVNSNVEPS